MEKNPFAYLISFFNNQNVVHDNQKFLPDNEQDRGLPERALDAAPGICAQIVDGVIVNANKYAIKQLEMGLGEDLHLFFESPQQLERLIGDKDEKPGEVAVLKAKNGELRRFFVSLDVFDSASGSGYIFWAFDIEKNEVKLEKNQKESDRLKAEFLEGISYDVLASANEIVRVAELLQVDKITGRQAQYVSDIKISAETMMSSINDVQDFAKISGGKVQITVTDIELGSFLKSIVSNVRVSARIKGLDLVEEITIKSPTYARIDGERLKRVLLKLLSNAIRFTEKGSVSFSARINDGALEFKVSDTGIGVKPEDVPVLFTAFGRAGKQRSRGMKGAGLGLAIAEGLITLMEGKIWLESEYGKGSAFYVNIPYIQGDESAARKGATEFEFISAPSANALVVDDIRTNLTLTAGLLRLCGITADVASSGKEAVRLAGKKDYDIVFMDHMMPEMDGVEAMGLIRGLSDKNAELPIIALTANSDDESRNYLLGAGMDDFLSKPLDKAELVYILKKWLPHDKIESVSGGNVPGEVTAYSEILLAVSQLDGIDIERALARISGMQDVLEQSIRQVANSIEGRLEKMSACLSQSNLKDFSVTVHGMKGALAGIGATRFSEMAAELEALSKASSFEKCYEKYAVFSREILELSKSLNSIFAHDLGKTLPKGDKEFLLEKAEAASLCLKRFETQEALTYIEEALAFSYGEKTDKLLNETREAVKEFRYKNAISLLENVADAE